MEIIKDLTTIVNCVTGILENEQNTIACIARSYTNNTLFVIQMNQTCYICIIQKKFGVINLSIGEVSKMTMKFH